MPENLDSVRLRALIEAGRLIATDLDIDAILGHLLETARALTGAQYAAVGVLDEGRTELERFVTRGLDAATEQDIGAPPRGRGVLGVLTHDPRTLRLSPVGAHPASYGFPQSHPPMTSFLGVPVLIRDEACGNLYLTEKAGGEEFDASDEEAAVVLAGSAGAAVENARLYRAAEERRVELERALHGLEATQAIAMAVGADTDLDHVLKLIVKRGRALVGARSVVIFLREGDDLVLVASAGQTHTPASVRIPIAASTSGRAMRDGDALRINDVHARMLIPPDQFGVTDATSALIVPLLYRDAALGVLCAFDRGEEAGSFDDEDERALKAFAASAATAVATAQSVQQDRVRYAMAAADAERRHWAQELHDETLQALGGLRVLLAATRRSADPAITARALDQAVETIEQEITNLRSIINDLRPAALDQLGLAPALTALFDRHRTVNDLEISARLPDPAEIDRVAAKESLLAATIYRVAQESLTNVVKHARADRVSVDLLVTDSEVSLLVSDNGDGFALDRPSAGFGLTGMRERVELTGGTLAVDADADGTRIRATMPLR